MRLQDFYPQRELTQSIGQQSVVNTQVNLHADVAVSGISCFVNVVTAYVNGGRIFNFVRSFPADVVLVICEEECH